MNKRLDTAESVFFKRQLKYIDRTLYNTKYRENKAFKVLPISTEIPSGATEYTWRTYTKYGFAKVVADYAVDFPRVDLFGTEQSIKIFPIGDSFGYSIMEIRRAAQAGFPLESQRAITARDVILQKHNSIALSGLSTNNINGLIDYPGITEYTVPSTGTGTTKTWSTKTAANILVDLNGIRDAIFVGTNGIEMPTIILLPMTQYQLIKDTPFNSYSDKTIYEFWTSNNPGIAIDWLKELDGAGDSSTDRFMAFPKDESHIKLMIPNLFERFEAERKGLQYTVPCLGETAGVVVYYTNAVAFGDGI